MSNMAFASNIHFRHVYMYSRIWASPTPSQNLVGSTNGMNPLGLKMWSGPDARSGWKSTPLLPSLLWSSMVGYPSDNLASCFWILYR